MDGTLLNTLEDIADAMNSILAAENIPPHPAERYKTFVGNGVNMMTRRALNLDSPDQSLIERCAEAFRASYRDGWNRKTELYPGIAPMLDQLDEQNIPLAILSNKPHEFMQMMVEEYLDNWEFEIVLGAGSRFPDKPDPLGALHISRQLRILPQHIALAGDSDVDILTAVNAGMIPIGVLWGFRTKEELLSAGAAVTAETPEDIVKQIL